MTAIWVLVILASGPNKGSSAAINGYVSKEMCQQAGRAFISETIEGRTSLENRAFVCIPSPSH